MENIIVNTGKPYSVLIGQSLLHESGELIKHYSNKPAAGRKLCIVTDDIVDRLYRQSVEDALTSAGYSVIRYVFSHGEQHKSLETVGNLLEFLAENQMTRSDALIALGGGVTGDLTGFTAAIYLRGIDFYQLPTTLLAAVDSSVGGKTGVNLNGGKNLTGAFWQPGLVIYDTNTFTTLSDDLKLDGIAESIKSGIIGDPELFQLMSANPDLTNLSGLVTIVARSITVKKQLVEEDERDTGKRQLLNLGHTVGHAIESCSGYTISHGHAVAMGMKIVSLASEANGWCTKAASAQILDCLDHYDFPESCPFNAEQLSAAAQTDKKRVGAQITLVIPEAIGRCTLKQLDIRELPAFIEKGVKGWI